MMDIGATLCTRSRPECHACPVADDCVALATGSIDRYPGKKPKKTVPVRQTVMLAVRSIDNSILLQRRPEQGVWGGLWSLPEIETATEVQAWATLNSLVVVSDVEAFAEFRHTFSHFHLDIRVLALTVKPQKRSNAAAIMEDQGHLWYNWNQLPGGIAAPVSKILELVGEPL